MALKREKTVGAWPAPIIEPVCGWMYEVKSTQQRAISRYIDRERVGVRTRPQSMGGTVSAQVERCTNPMDAAA